MKWSELKLKLIAFWGKLFILTLGYTWKVKIIDRANLGKQNALYAFWHGRLLIPTYTHRNKNFYCLISQHRDGEYISKIVEGLGHNSVRGSTTRGGTKAILQLIERGSGGVNLAITPDGPKGPKHFLKPGLLYIAFKTGLPIIPVGSGASKYIRFKSWDNFLLPLPLSKCVVLLDAPIYIKTLKNIEKKKEKIEAILKRLQYECDRYVAFI